MEGEMKYEQSRRDSFPLWWFYRHQIPISFEWRLTAAGFYWYGSKSLGGYTRCFSSGLDIPPYFWEKGHDPDTVHRERRPNCNFVKGKSNNVPLETLKQKVIKCCFNEPEGDEEEDDEEEDDNQIKLHSGTKQLDTCRSIKPEPFKESTITNTFSSDVKRWSRIGVSIRHRERVPSDTKQNCAVQPIKENTTISTSSYISDVRTWTRVITSITHYECISSVTRNSCTINAAEEIGDLGPVKEIASGCFSTDVSRNKLNITHQRIGNCGNVVSSSDSEEMHDVSFIKLSPFFFLTPMPTKPVICQYFRSLDSEFSIRSTITTT